MPPPHYTPFPDAYHQATLYTVPSAELNSAAIVPATTIASSKINPMRISLRKACRSAGAQPAAFADQALHLRARQAFKMRQHELVETLMGFVYDED